MIQGRGRAVDIFKCLLWLMKENRCFACLMFNGRAGDAVLSLVPLLN